MKLRKYFFFAGLIAFTGVTGISCSNNSRGDASNISTTSIATEANVTTSIVPTPTLSTVAMVVNPTAIPYPTANVVQANAVAFIDLVGIGYSLWIANVDGSGERKLTDIESNASQSSNYLLQWSPDGKWISYISGEDLWITSPDGLTKRKIISFSGKDKGLLRAYRWSPDSWKIAYLQARLGDSPPTSSLGLVDIKSGEVSELLSYEPSSSFIVLISSLSWSPDGHYLLFNKTRSFALFDTTTYKISKEITLDGECPVLHYEPTWSPNGQWLYHPVYGTGGEYSMRVCVSELDGSSEFVYTTISSQLPAWDKTGNLLYFTVRRINQNSADIDQRLVRYDLRTQEIESILSLGKSTLPYIWSLSMSPDGNTLVLDAQNSKEKQSLILLNVDSLTTTRFDIAEVFYTGFFPRGNIWAADNKNLVFLSGASNNLIFYRLNTQTEKTTAISGEHSVEYWAISPVATSP